MEKKKEDKTNPQMTIFRLKFEPRRKISENSKKKMVNCVWIFFY